MSANEAPHSAQLFQLHSEETHRGVCTGVCVYMFTPVLWVYGGGGLTELTLPHRGQHLQTVVRVQSLQQVHQALRSWVVQLQKDHKSCPGGFLSPGSAAGSLDHQPDQQEPHGE